MDSYNFGKLTPEEQKQILEREQEEHGRRISELARSLYVHRGIIKEFYKLLVLTHNPTHPSPIFGPQKADGLTLSHRDGVRTVLIGIKQFIDEAEEQSKIQKP